MESQRFPGFRRCAAALAFLSVVVLPTPRVGAMREDDYDLASLILESHAVILAERGSQRPLKNWAAATPYTVKKVYCGVMLPGLKIELFEPARPDPAKGLSVDSLGEKKLAVDPEEILIVAKWDLSTSVMRSWLPKDTPSLRPVERRFLSGGRVYKYEGGVLQSQGSDPGDPDPRPGDSKTLAEFEDDLRRAIAKVARFQTASSLKEPGDRKKAVLEVIRDQTDFIGFEEPFSHEGYADRLRQKALVMFAKAGDIESALEVAARSPVGLGFHFRCPISDGDLMGAAGRQDLPPRLRTAALYLVARSYPTAPDGVLRRAQDLLESKDAGVKQAAAHLLAQALRIHALNPGQYTAEDSAPITKALQDAWRREHDPAFRITVLRASRGRGFPATLSADDLKPDVLLAGSIRKDRARFMMTSVSGQRLALTSWVVVATRCDTGVEHRSPATDGVAGSKSFGGTSPSCGSFPVQFEPELPPGRYRMWIEARSALSDGRESIHRSAAEEIEVTASPLQR